MRLSQQSIAFLQRRAGMNPNGVADETFFANDEIFQGKRGDIPEAIRQVELLIDRLDTVGDPRWDLVFRRIYPGARVEKVPLMPAVSGSFLPEGVIVHHTAGPKGRKKIDVEALAHGRPDLSGPLANVGISRDGSVSWITNGRAHHAGEGSSKALARVRGDCGVLIPVEPDDGTYGNSYFFGIEIDNSGRVDDPYPQDQVLAAAQVAALLCYFWKWPPLTRVLGHKEWTRRKVDPSFDMDDFRGRVNLELRRLREPAPEPESELAKSLEARIVELERRLLVLERFQGKMA